MMKRPDSRDSYRAALFLVPMLFAVALVWPSTAQVAAEKSPPRQLKVGFIVALTGPLAEFGEAIRNGVILAREDNPKLKEVFEDVYEDSHYDSRTAVTNFKKLRFVDKVDAVYVFGGPMSDTLAPIAERAQMPMFSTEYDVRYTRGKKYVIRFANNATDYAEALLSELRSRKLHRFGIVKVENQYHNTLSRGFLESLGQGETAEVLYNFQPNENDFRAVFPKLRSHGFDAIGFYFTPGVQNTFFSQARNSGVRFQNVFGTDSFESREENRGVEELVDGALFANSYVSKEFSDRYRKRFESSAQIVHAALAYEFAKLVGELFANRQLPDSPDEFVKRFSLSTGRKSVCGEYFYRDSPETGKYFSFPIAVRTVRSGEPVVIAVSEAP